MIDDEQTISNKQFEQLTLIGWIGFAVQSAALNLLTNSNNDLYVLSIVIVSCISSMFLLKGKN